MATLMTAGTLRPCFCACHTYPGTYPTTVQRPCFMCGHVDDQGEMIGSIRDGWVKK